MNMESMMLSHNTFAFCDGTNTVHISTETLSRNSYMKMCYFHGCSPQNDIVLFKSSPINVSLTGFCLTSCDDSNVLDLNNPITLDSLNYSVISMGYMIRSESVSSIMKISFSFFFRITAQYLIKSNSFCVVFSSNCVNIQDEEFSFQKAFFLNCRFDTSRSFATPKHYTFSDCICDTFSSPDFLEFNITQSVPLILIDDFEPYKGESGDLGLTGRHNKSYLFDYGQENVIIKETWFCNIVSLNSIIGVEGNNFKLSICQTRFQENTVYNINGIIFMGVRTLEVIGCSNCFYKNFGSFFICLYSLGTKKIELNETTVILNDGMTDSMELSLFANKNDCIQRLL